MRKWLSKRDRAIKEAFQIYGAANAEAESKSGQKEKMYLEKQGDKGTGYWENLEESAAEDKIYRMIERLPIKNPRKKARRIWAVCVTLTLLCVLAGCMGHYIHEKPFRVTRTLQEIYQNSAEDMALREIYPSSDEDVGQEEKGLSSGKDMAQGEEIQSSEGNEETDKIFLVTTEEGLLYRCHSLSRKEQGMLDKKGAAFQEDRENRYSVKTYHLSDRKSRQFILVKDEEGAALGRFVSCVPGNGSTNVTLDLLLKNVMGINSPDDIRTVTFERSQAVSAENPEKLVAMWTDTEDKEWFYQFLSGSFSIVTPFLKDVAERGTENAQVLEQSLPVTHGKNWHHWKSQILKEIPEKAFYLQIENKMRETFLLGVLMENDNVELWIEPLEQLDEEHAVVVLPKGEQKKLADLLRRMLLSYAP